MTRYLSPEWFEEVNQQADEAQPGGDPSPGASITLQQVVTDGPDGEVRYWVRLEDGKVRTGLGDAPEADATVRQSYETAVAILRGELSVQSAFMAGRIRLSGDLRALMDHQEALRGADAFADVRRRTSYR